MEVVVRVDDEVARVVQELAASSDVPGLCERVSETIGSSHANTSSTGTPYASEPDRTAARVDARDEKPGHGEADERNREEERVRRMHEGEVHASRGERQHDRPRRPSRTNRKKSVTTAGTSSCRATVPGSSSDVYAPPPPGANAISATCASIVATPSHAERKTTRPIS